MRINIWLMLIFVLGIAGCSSVQAPAPVMTPSVTDWAALSGEASTQPPATATPMIWVELPLVTTVSENYVGLSPAAWVEQPDSDASSVLFTSPDDPGFGFQVHLTGSGYDFGVLDALLNNEIQLMRQEGLAPQEVGLRRPVDLAGEVGSGRLASFTVTFIEGDLDEPGWLQLAALLTDRGTAYVFRLWGTAAGANQTDYTQALQRIVQAFQPVIDETALVDASGAADATSSPSPEATTEAATEAATPAPDQTPSGEASPEATFAVRTVTLNPEPYRGETFNLYYPDGWFPTQGVAGMINFLDVNPHALVGISALMLGTGYDPDQDAETLLANYLDDVQDKIPSAVIGDQQVAENPFTGVSGISTTYLVPINQGHLVYRVTVLVTAEGAAYRLLQWAPYDNYETQYRDLYRMVVGGFRPVSVADQADDDQTTGENTP